MSRIEPPEDLRNAVVKSAEKTVERAAEGADHTGARIARHADRAVAHTGLVGLKTGTRVGAAGARIGIKGSKLGARGMLFGAKASVRERLRPAREAKVKAQLQHASRDLVHKTSDLEHVVESLDAVIRANRRGGAVGRTRLFVGIVVGAVATYHLDAQSGAQRRAKTRQRIVALTRGT